MLDKLIRSRTKRVRLNVLAMEKAMAGAKQMAVASAINARRQGSISPSTLTRYLSGERSPSIGQALQIAAALGLDPVELILGYAADKRSKSTTWERDLAEKSHLPLGIDLHGFLRESGHYVKFLHVDHVVDGGPFRFAFSTVDGEIGFASLAIRVEPGDRPSTIRFLYRSHLIPGFPLISEIGKILIDEKSIRSVENWTLRRETRPIDDPSEPLRIRFWQDRGATAFFLISEKPFAIDANDRVVHVETGDHDPNAVTFQPTGFHKFSNAKNL